jgi:vacuolar-type H+-ATPase subunit H
MLKERDEYLAKMQREGDDIVHAARMQAERMVQRTEIVREAQGTARRIVEDARDEARRLRLEAEDYCDQKLAAFEVVLDRTIKTVAAGRAKLSVTPPPILDGPDQRVAGIEADDPFGGDEAFFDQDLP